MKHVVCAASPRADPCSDRCVLVTGFGAFPGARSNPTAAILRRLERRTGRLARLGIELRCLLIPVVYAEIEPTLQAAIACHRPSAVLHLGLAGRRRAVCVETRAVNRAGPLHPDAAARRPARQVLAPGAPQSLASTYPAHEILAAVRRSGVAARLSNDAGDYVCNATLFASLAAQLAPQVGFLHVPRTFRRQATRPADRPSLDALVRAVEAAIIVMGRRRPPFRRPETSPTAPPTDGGPSAR